MNEQRRVLRVSLPEPLAGVAADERVFVVDASLRGVRIAHRTLFSCRADLPIAFQWDGNDIEVVGSLRWTKLQRGASELPSKPLYQSGIEINSLRADTEGALRGLVEYHVERALDEQIANARGVPPFAAQSVLTGQGSTYARHELINGVWRKIVTTNREQPLCGFTVASTEAGDQIELLRRAYEIADAQMKRIIQKVADLTTSSGERIPMRRYTP